MRRFDGRDVKVLVIDGNEHFRRLLRTVLQTVNIDQISEAADGAQALEMLRHFAADLIILDWKTEPLDGISFALKLRRSAESPDAGVPMIMVAADPDGALAREAAQAGIDAFLPRPLSATALIGRVVAVLSGLDRRRHPPAAD